MSALPPIFTVAIPTFNGAKRVPLVLEKLRSQVTPADLDWEIIVIDNNSADNIAEVVEAYRTDPTFTIPIRYFREPRQGAAFARHMAIAEAKGSIIGFLDDDNLPTSSWITTAVAFAQSHPQAGAFNGRIHAIFESELPEGFNCIQQFLALRDHGNQPKVFEPEKLRLPPGAGVVIRKEAWENIVPLMPRIPGRTERLYIGGHDYEVLLYMHKAGWQIHYCPDLQIEHMIPSERLERSALLKLAYGSGLSTCELKLVTATRWQRPMVIGRVLLGNLKRSLQQVVRHQRQLKTDLVPAFDLAFALGGIISVVYSLFGTSAAAYCSNKILKVLT
jgi:glycosyltransferase involved in cell wall biosynthesis